MSQPRSVLRNRKTGEVFHDVHPNHLTNFNMRRRQTMFTSSAEPQSSEAVEFTQFLRNFDDYVADMKSKNPDMPVLDEAGNTILDLMAKDMSKQFRRFGVMKKAGGIIQQLNLLNNKSELNEEELQKKQKLTATLSKIIADSSKETVSEDSSTLGCLKQFVKTLGMAQVASIFPGAGLVAGLVLSQVTAAAAQSACPSGNWQVNTGIPTGAPNPCSDLSGPYVSCEPGYLTCGNNPWVTGDSQYSLGAQLAGGQYSGNAGASIALGKCFGTSINSLGNVVIDILNTTSNPGSGAAVTCSNTLPSWQSMQSRVNAVLPNTLCADFYASANSVVQNCQSWDEQAKWNAIIAGSVIGGVVLIAAACIATFYCLTNDKCCKR